ncbi:MAG: MotA/TolQ/ExbB proton channel family protein [Akkermansiaceae bacterium]|nr:MotA/TolQ/ExbB proton channel family protein [Akkermansiaceae bacterium]
MLHTIQQFFEACHPFGYPLLICSIILVTAIFYHYFSTGSRAEIHKLFALYDKLRKKDSTAMQEVQQSKQELSREVAFLLEHKNDENLPSIMESRLKVLVDNQRAGLAIISVITNIAPMLGILGTAWGLVDIFGVFGTPGAQEGIALGISKALYTTIFGLAIAIPGMIALTCAERALEHRAALIDELFTELLAHRNEI